MRNLFTLVMMQLKDKTGLSFLASKKRFFFSIIWFILKFALITAVLYFAFSMISFFRLTAILPGIPQNFISVVFTIMILLSLIVCTLGLTRSLYIANDNRFLLTLPVSRATVFTSRLIVYYIYEVIRNITFFMPLMVAYGMINGMPFYYYFWIILSLLVLTALIVSVAALLSIPMLYITKFIGDRKWLGYTLLSVAAVGVVAAVIWIVGIIPADINLVRTWGTTFWKIQNFLGAFNSAMAPFTYVTMVAVGYRYGITNNVVTSTSLISLVVILGVIAVTMLLCYFIVRPLYFKMASSPFEYKRVAVKRQIKNHAHGAVASTIKKDFLLTVRQPEKFFSLIAISVGMPIAVFLLNKFYAAMNTSFLGMKMTIAFNVLIIMIIALASNAALAKIYSEDGKSAYLTKTVPESYLKQLTPRLCLNFVFITASIIASCIIFAVFAKFKVVETILLILTIECVYAAHMLWSAEMDLMNSQANQYQTSGSHVNNPNEIKSTITSFLLSALFAFLTFFFAGEGIADIFTKMIVFAVLFFGIRLWLFINKVNIYYKEMQP